VGDIGGGRMRCCRRAEGLSGCQRWWWVWYSRSSADACGRSRWMSSLVSGVCGAFSKQSWLVEVYAGSGSVVRSWWSCSSCSRPMCPIEVVFFLFLSLPVLGGLLLALGASLYRPSHVGVCINLSSILI
jgi:hypothetical protein